MAGGYDKPAKEGVSLEKGAEATDEKPRMSLVEFEHLTFNFRDFNKIYRGFRQTKDGTGIEYFIRLLLDSHPFEEVFIYPEEEERNKAYELLKMRLEELRFKFYLAVPMTLTFKVEEEQENWPEEEDLFDGLDELQG